MVSSGDRGYVGKTAFLPALPGEDRESGTVCNVVSPDKRRPGRGLGHNGFRPAGRRRGPRAERQRCFHGARRGGRRDGGDGGRGPPERDGGGDRKTGV